MLCATREKAPKFEPFVPDKEAYANDDDEQAYQEGCAVVWPDDPIIPVVPSGDGTTTKSNEPPPSYRFTPREERVGFGGPAGRRCALGAVPPPPRRTPTIEHCRTRDDEHGRSPDTGRSSFTHGALYRQHLRRATQPGSAQQRAAP